MSTPNWNKLSKITLKECCEFRAERFDRWVHEMWNDIVKKSDHDNDEIKSIWLRSCDGNVLMKTEFLAWILSSREPDEYRPIDWKDVLRYLRYLSIKEKQEARDIKVSSYKYQ